MVSQAVFIASLLTFIFSVLSALHWYWAFGGKWGLDGVVPSVDGKPTFSPGRLPTIVVACALLIAGLVCLWRVGVIAVGLPVWIPSSGVWVLAVVFFARAVGDFRLFGFFKWVRDSEFARRDTLIYSPLCALISALVLWLGIVAG